MVIKRYGALDVFELPLENAAVVRDQQAERKAAARKLSARSAALCAGLLITMDVNRNERMTRRRRDLSTASSSTEDVIYGERDEPENSGAPIDRNSVTYWSCVILGISSLLPWNLFITAHGYFSYKFRLLNDSSSSRADNHSGGTSGALTTGTAGAAALSSLESSFEVYFGLTSSSAGVLAAIASVILSPHIPAHARMVGGHGMVMLSFMVAFIFTFVNTDAWQVGFLVVNLVLILIGQLGCNVIAGCTFALAAQLPESRFTNAVVSAQAFAGVFTSVINIVSTAIGSSMDQAKIGAVYFAMALAFILFSLIVYFWLMKNSYAQYHVKKASMPDLITDTEPLLADPLQYGVLDTIGTIGNEDGNQQPQFRQKTMIAFLRKTWYHGLSLIMTLSATLICFPALTSLVRSTVPTSSPWNVYFIPVACFLFFNLMDFVGRLVGNWKLWPKPNSPLIGLFVLVRFGFVFLFLFCNLPPYGVDGHWKVFSDDSYFVMFMLLLGLTNGYLVNVTSTYIPASVDKQDSDRAGCMTVFSLSTGLLSGSIISFFVVKVVTQQW